MVARDFESPADENTDNAYEVTVKATDADGNTASASITVTVTDVTETATVTISGLADASVAENTSWSATASASGAIGTVAWSKEGTDAADFTLDASSGALAMVARDFESPADENTDNAYEVTVKATDADGNSASASITVTVTDATEPPGKPAAPSVSVSASSTTGLDVSWAAPSNTGPAISGYDLRYRAGTTGDFTDGPQDVTSTSSAITGLQVDTTYQVQVRATNAEGDGPWSDSGAATIDDTTPKWALPPGFVFEDAYEARVNIPFSLTLPPATGDGTLTYSLRPEAGAALPAGLYFDPGHRRLWGTPTTIMPRTGYRYTVTDGDGDTTTVDFAIEVVYTGQLVAQHHLIDDTLLVGWAPSTESGVTGYLIQWKTGAQQYSTTERSHTAGPEVSSYQIGDLPLGVYTVKVTQQGGDSDGTSFEGTVTLHGWPGVVYVDPVAGDARAVDVQWDTVSTAAGYVIEWKPASDSEYPEANRASVAAANVKHRTFTNPTTGEKTSFPTHRVSGLQPDTKYDARVTVYTAAGSAADPDGLSDENHGTTHGEITGLSVAAVDGETTKLDASWNAPVTSVARFKVGGYRVQWKSGAGDYPEANKATVSTVTSHRITGLAAGTTYSVKVTVLGKWYGIHEDGDSAEATGATAAGVGAPGESAAPRFLIYHDPGAGAGAVERYHRAIALLRSSGRAYTVRTVTGTGEVERLAGVSGSVIPRFFLGDPTVLGWGPSQPQVNNGGLRWLISVLAQSRAPSTPAPEVSVADARVREADGATLDFAVTLDTASTATVTVDYATADGTAKAGEDYTATSGTLSFAPGETEKTVSVPVLDDAHDEGEETLALTLSNAAGARVADGAATGTIVNADPMPKAWLARFGRTVGGQVVDALASRLDGGGESYGTVGGVQLGSGEVPADAHGAETEPPRWDDAQEQEEETRTMTLEELILGSAFHLSSGGKRDGRPRLRRLGAVRAGLLRGRRRGRRDGRRRHHRLPRGRCGVGAGAWGGAVLAQPERGFVPRRGRLRKHREHAHGPLSLRAARLERAGLGLGARRLRRGHAHARGGRAGAGGDRPATSHGRGGGDRTGAGRRGRGRHRARHQVRRDVGRNEERGHGRPGGERERRDAPAAHPRRRARVHARRRCDHHPERRGGRAGRRRRRRDRDRAGARGGAALWRGPGRPRGRGAGPRRARGERVRGVGRERHGAARARRVGPGGSRSRSLRPGGMPRAAPRGCGRPGMRGSSVPPASSSRKGDSRPRSATASACLARPGDDTLCGLDGRRGRDPHAPDRRALDLLPRSHPGARGDAARRHRRRRARALHRPRGERSLVGRGRRHARTGPPMAPTRASMPRGSRARQ